MTQDKQTRYAKWAISRVSKHMRGEAEMGVVIIISSNSGGLRVVQAGHSPQSLPAVLNAAAQMFADAKTVDAAVHGTPGDFMDVSHTLEVASQVKGGRPTEQEIQSLSVDASLALARARQGGCFVVVTADPAKQPGDLDCYVLGPDEFVADTVDTLTARYLSKGVPRH